MIGRLDPEQREVTVIGGGISGLVTAYRLDQSGYRVTLLEKSDRLGGVIRTSRTELGLAEAAVHSLIATPEVRNLFAELGVQLVPAANRDRFVFRRGRPRKLPVGPLALLRAAIRAYFLLPVSGGAADRLTVEEWGRRHLGQELLDYGLNAFLRGIYAARPSEIAMGAAFPGWVVPRGHSLISSQIARRLTRRLPMPPAPRGAICSVAGGMQSLVEALERHLSESLGPRLCLETEVLGLPNRGNVILAVPARAAAELLLPDAPELAERLRRIRYAPMVSVTAWVDRDRVPRSVRGLGVLIPERETGPECLGVLFNSSAFPDRVKDPERVASFTLMYGGTSNPGVLGRGDGEIQSSVESDLRKVLGIDGGLLDLRIHRWPQAIPVYSVELMDAWETARQSWCAKPGRLLAGNWTGQVSVRGMIEDAAIGKPPRVNPDGFPSAYSP